MTARPQRAKKPVSYIESDHAFELALDGEASGEEEGSTEVAATTFKGLSRKRMHVGKTYHRRWASREPSTASGEALEDSSRCPGSHAGYKRLAQFEAPLKHIDGGILEYTRLCMTSY